MYHTADGCMAVGVHDGNLVCQGVDVCIECMADYVTTIAEVTDMVDCVEYTILDDGNGIQLVVLGPEPVSEAEMYRLAKRMMDQVRHCNNCAMSRGMDRYHNQTPRVPERVALGPNQTLAYGTVVDLMTYDEAVEHITWYLQHVGDQGEAMLADVSTSAYEIVLRHVMIGDTHYAGDSDYVSTAVAERLVDAGLADYMVFEQG